MLDCKHHENDRRAQHECRIEAQRQTIGDEAEIRDRPRPGNDRRIRIKEYGQQIAGAQTGADCKDRRPGKPVRPQRQRRQDPAIANPCRSAVHCGSTGLRGMKAGDFGIGESLRETEQDGNRPDKPCRRADGRRDSSHGEQHQRRNTGHNEDDLYPVDVPNHIPLRCDIAHGSPLLPGPICPITEPVRWRGLQDSSNCRCSANGGTLSYP